MGLDFLQFGSWLIKQSEKKSKRSRKSERTGSALRALGDSWVPKQRNKARTRQWIIVTGVCKTRLGIQAGPLVLLCPSLLSFLRVINAFAQQLLEVSQKSASSPISLPTFRFFAKSFPCLPSSQSISCPGSARQGPHPPAQLKNGVQCLRIHFKKCSRWENG